MDATTITDGALWVQHRSHGMVLDAAVYCRPCFVNGVFTWASGGDHMNDELVVRTSDDRVLCTGCGELLNQSR